MHDVLDLRDILADELLQRRESGYDVDDLEGAVKEATSNGSPAERERVLDELEHRPLRQDWHYDEPSDWQGIQAVIGRAVQHDAPCRIPVDQIQNLRDIVHHRFPNRKIRETGR